MKSLHFFTALVFIALFLAACQANVPPPTASPATLTPTSSQPTAPQPAAETAVGTASPTTANPQATATPPAPVEPSLTATAEATPTADASPTSTPVASATDASTPGSLATPGAAATATTAAAVKDCQDLAAFYGDITIPDDTFFRAGEQFTKTWRFRNEGTCTWTTGYQVVYYGGEMMNAPLTNPFPKAVAPGEQVDISLDMTAPSRGGNYVSNWEFVDDQGNRFGTGKAAADPFWVKIDVGFVDTQGTPVPIPTPVANTGGGNPGGGNTVGASTGGGNSAVVPLGCSAAENTSFESQIVALINQQRQQNGLAPLKANSQLTAAAAVHSADMACNNYLNHTGSDGSTWYSRIQAQGYAYNLALENIYAGDPVYGGGTPQGVVDWWMNSPVHRANILNPDVTEIGIGVFIYTQSDFQNYFTADFAEP